MYVINFLGMAKFISKSDEVVGTGKEDPVKKIFKFDNGYYIDNGTVKAPGGRPVGEINGKYIYGLSGGHIGELKGDTVFRNRKSIGKVSSQNHKIEMAAGAVLLYFDRVREKETSPKPIKKSKKSPSQKKPGFLERLIFGGK